MIYIISSKKIHMQMRIYNFIEINTRMYVIRSIQIFICEALLYWSLNFSLAVVERNLSRRIENSGTRSILADERRSQRDKSRFTAGSSFLTKETRRSEGSRDRESKEKERGGRRRREVDRDIPP